MSITNPANHEVCSVIQFFNAEIIHSAKIHCQLVEVGFGYGVMDKGSVRKWCLMRKGQMCTLVTSGVSAS
jgi:hypothetical protein